MDIPAHIYDEMIEHALAAAPEEACGLLAAGPDGRATTAYCIANLDASLVSYTLDPAGHIRALHHADSRGWHLAAVFHSHPAGIAVPSAADVSGALEPEWLHIVIGMAGADGPAVRGFRIRDGVTTEEPLVILETA